MGIFPVVRRAALFRSKATQHIDNSSLFYSIHDSELHFSHPPSPNFECSRIQHNQGLQFQKCVLTVGVGAAGTSLPDDLQLARRGLYSLWFMVFLLIFEVGNAAVAYRARANS